MGRERLGRGSPGWLEMGQGDLPYTVKTADAAHEQTHISTSRAGFAEVWLLPPYLARSLPLRRVGPFARRRPPKRCRFLGLARER